MNSRVLEKSGAKSRNKQGESREPGRVESGIKEARVGKQERRESGNIDQSRETWTIGARPSFVTLPAHLFLAKAGCARPYIIPYGNTGFQALGRSGLVCGFKVSRVVGVRGPLRARETRSLVFHRPL